MNNLDIEAKDGKIVPVFNALIPKSRLRPESKNKLKKIGTGEPVNEKDLDLTFECQLSLFIVEETYCTSHIISNNEGKLNPVVSVNFFSLKERESAIKFLSIPKLRFEGKEIYFLWFEGKEMLISQHKEIFKLWKTTLPI